MNRILDIPRRIMTGFVVSALVLGLTACSGGGDPSPSGSSKVVVALTTFAHDTALSWTASAGDEPIFGQVYNRLVTQNDDGKEVPDLAQSWDISPDGLTYTFHLRKNVQFHKGYGELTADDVVFTMEKWMDKTSTGSVPQLVQSSIASFDKVDKYTVKVVLKQPSWGFLWMLTNSAWIHSKKYVTEVGEDKASKEPVGTGPFQWESTPNGSEKIFTKFSDYFGHKAAYDELDLRMIPDETTALSGLRSGEIDAVQVSGESLQQAESDKFTVFKVPDAQQQWVVLPGLTMPGTPAYKPSDPWVGDEDDVTSRENATKVRRALAMAIDKQAIIDSLWGGVGSLDSFGYFVRKGFVGWSPNWKPLPYDPDQAKELLGEAGYPDGFTINLVDWGARADTTAVTQAIGQYWEAIGVKVKLGKKSVDTVLGEMAERSKSMDYAFVYSTPVLVALSIHNYASDSSFRYLLNDAEVDAQTAKVMAELDEKKRAALIEKLVDRQVSGQYGLQIASTGPAFAVSDRIDKWALKRGVSTFNNYEYIELSH